MKAMRKRNFRNPLLKVIESWGLLPTFDQVSQSHPPSVGLKSRWRTFRGRSKTACTSLWSEMGQTPIRRAVIELEDSLMAGNILSWEKIKAKSNFKRPHVVILGAGASLAALANGDRNGSVLPLMNNLVDVLGLTDTIEQGGFDSRDRNFEDVYCEISADPEAIGLRKVVEKRVSNYFSSLCLPETPTLYDYLVLSLREKDCIATFNWDPFLYQACCRNHRVTRMPHCLYLHGCSIVGYCIEHMTQGLLGTKCSKCGAPFTAGPLLFPVGDKDYVNNEYIGAQWRTLQHVLEDAYVLTIFGYGAPASDSAAVNLMKKAWGSPEERRLEQIEIIDIKQEKELRRTWSRFIHTHHYQATDSYFSSSLSMFPRRTCEATWEQFMEVNWVEPHKLNGFDSMAELQAWAIELASHEGTLA